MKKISDDILFDTVNTILLSIICLGALYPLIYVLSASISDPVIVNQGKMWLLPKGITFDGYIRVFSNKEIWTGYMNSLIYAVSGTLISMVLTLLCAYPLSRKDFAGRQLFTGIITFTMFFSGGLIPTYLLIKDLGMVNTVWALLIPGSLSVWNMIITRTYFQTSIPFELQEAAMIDGYSNTRLFFAVVLPLSVPIIAVMALFYAIGQWNSYFQALIYISQRSLYPLQLVLREILVQQQMGTMMMNGVDMETMAEQAKIADIIKYAVIIVATLPALIVYPFVQKHFIKGIMVGSIKG